MYTVYSITIIIKMTKLASQMKNREIKESIQSFAFKLIK